MFRGIFFIVLAIAFLFGFNYCIHQGFDHENAGQWYWVPIGVTSWIGIVVCGIIGAVSLMSYHKDKEN